MSRPTIWQVDLRLFDGACSCPGEGGRIEEWEQRHPILDRNRFPRSAVGLDKQAVCHHDRSVLGASKEQHGGARATIRGAGESMRSKVDRSRTVEPLGAARFIRLDRQLVADAGRRRDCVGRHSGEVRRRSVGGHGSVEEPAKGKDSDEDAQKRDERESGKDPVEAALVVELAVHLPGRDGRGTHRRRVTTSLDFTGSRYSTI
jgi:hypothetical protein